MIAYNKQTLDNLAVKEQTAAALRRQLITTEEATAVGQAYPVNFYTPNPVIRIGLFILTVIILLAALGLFLLMGASSSESAIRGMLLAVGICSYIALEVLVRSNHYYHAGIDDALLWVALLLIGITIGFESHMSPAALYLIAAVLTGMATLRFADMILAGISYLSLVMLMVYTIIQTGLGSSTVVPFAVMLFSAGVYFVAKRLTSLHICRHYKNCLIVVEVLSLVTLYMSGNYFVVREGGQALLGTELQPGQDIPAGWFFWIFSGGIPLAYIWAGIRRKDVVLLRTGLLLIAAIVFTIRYYHHILPLEDVMVLGGILLTGGAWLLIRYLRTPRQGFTYEETDEALLADKLNVESLVIAQTYTPVTPTPPDVTFGGGTGGGGGASGNY
ncbi:MAG TPA: hypothetical protein VM802_28510 [Chitinophaga sp.]|uniref:hypothetical protein n=1 Tax=Chitinophaga sp. TaxID=1869181 RepID=UPI002C99A29F|nr:hypothetical protein [Chitinophaga sp.]HVI48846.1 hypothetical protein [Chitinophaga sp.]